MAQTRSSLKRSQNGKSQSLVPVAQQACHILISDFDEVRFLPTPENDHDGMIKYSASGRLAVWEMDPQKAPENEQQSGQPLKWMYDPQYVRIMPHGTRFAQLIYRIPLREGDKPKPKPEDAEPDILTVYVPDTVHAFKVTLTGCGKFYRHQAAKVDITNVCCYGTEVRFSSRRPKTKAQPVQTESTDS